MTHRFAELMFTPDVQAVQTRLGSRSAYARLAATEASGMDRLGASERNFIAARDSFYIATVNETGWPYVQHRGGPEGFLKVLDEDRIGFADYSGNRQYVTVGNLAGDDRVSLFLMDYPNRRRLKILGHATLVDASDQSALQQLSDHYQAKVERGMLIDVEGFDWNCPQHITPRLSESELREVLNPIRERLRALEAENVALRARAGLA